MALFNLYVPVNLIEKKDCWTSLSQFIETHYPINIIVAGDLNIILHPMEKKGGVRGKDHFHEFVETLIHAWDLLDFKPKKGRFTWSNNRVGAAITLARLDRFLVQSLLMDGNSLISSKILLKLTSYHNPISLLFEEEEDIGPIPFRFSPLWMERDGFWESESCAWSQFVDGSPSYVWEQKLKRLKFALKRWIKKPLSTPFSHMKESVHALE